MDSGTDGEIVKVYDLKYARQVEALARLCKANPGMGFECNPMGKIAEGVAYLYCMGPYVLDNEMRALGAVPLMLSENKLFQSPKTPDAEIAFSHAVLVRMASEEEEQLQLESPLPRGQYLACLELLRFVEKRKGITWFARTGIMEFYPY